MTDLLKHAGSFVDMKISRRFNTVPRSILFPFISITNRCNCRCMMCGQRQKPQGPQAQELTFNEWCSFIESARRQHAAVITITGGEPFLRADIFDLITFIRAQGMACHVCTNGSLLSERSVERLIGTGLNSISVSLDSDCAAVHNNLRQKDYFDDAVQSIKLLALGFPRLNIGINCVITRVNLAGIHRMVGFANKLGAQQVKFDVMHANLMHRHGDSKDFNGLLLKEHDIPVLESEIRMILESSAETRTVTNSPAFFRYLLRQRAGKQAQISCYAGYISCFIDSFGNVAACENFDGAGNVRENSFEQIWRSPEFQSQREKLRSCREGCVDTTHGALNIRCRLRNAFVEAGCFKEELRFFLERGNR